MKKCEVCPNTFEPIPYWMIYCSRKCRDAANYLKKKKKGWVADYYRKKRSDKAAAK